MIGWIAAGVAVVASGSSVYFAVRSYRAVKRAREAAAQALSMARRRR